MDTGYYLHIKPREVLEIFKAGDLVRIRPEWRDGKEKDILYRIADVNESTGRCYIEPEFSDLPIPPQELVSFEMIRKADCADRSR